MKEAVKKITIRVVAFVMIALFAMLAANKSLFTHTHILVDGSLITHAHPYNKTNDNKPFKTHQHTKAGLLFFENLKILFVTIFVVLTIVAVKKKPRYVQHAINLSNLPLLHFQKRRAPPIS